MTFHGKVIIRSLKGIKFDLVELELTSNDESRAPRGWERRANDSRSVHSALRVWQARTIARRWPHGCPSGIRPETVATGY